MSNDQTAETLRLSSFEERVLAQLNDLSVRIATLQKRIAEIDAETKPNWERIHKDFLQLHKDMKASFAGLDRKFDVMNKELFQIKADQVGIETRLEKIESEATPQVIVQDRQF
jgi:hypothetical protein